MRNMTITLTTEHGKLQVSESTGWPEGYPPSEPWLAMMIKDLAHRLDVLERDGPWKPETLNIEQIAPLPDQRVTREQFKTWGDPIQ